MSQLESAPDLAQQRTRAARRQAASGWLAAHRGLWLALGIGLAGKAALLATGSVTFNADEAILALMARHILQGDLPTFFYGQAYMGALHAYLIAPAFLIFGQTVLAARLVQVGLTLGVVATTYALARRIGRSSWAAGAAGLLVAAPPVMASLYTTAALGNYVEVLLINNLLWLIGWGILSGERDGGGWWLLAGALAGLGWWGMALVAVSAGPLAALGVWRFRRRMPWGRAGLLALGFVSGALPWLAALAADPGAFLGELAGRGVIAPEVSAGLGPGAAGRIASLLVFNLPALIGLRAPWSAGWIAPPAGLLAGALYAMALWWALRRTLDRSEPRSTRLALGSLLGGWAALLAAFVFTSFGGDPTGRYLLPLYPPLAAIVGEWLARMRAGGAAGAWVAPALLAGLVSSNLWGNLQAVREDPPGLTTQFDLISHLPHEYDDDLIGFLDSVGAERGYSNYWVAYRFAFLTGERIVLAPALPYKTDLSYTERDNRYPPYMEMARAAPRVVYVTSNLPQLDAALRGRFAGLGVAHRERRIGPYTVFYDLSRAVRPEELGRLDQEDGG